MKKIINGKMYNTETAEYIASWDYSYPGDFHYVSETLYKKKNGKYFIHGCGGPLSKYSEQVDSNWWQGGAEIIPMTENEVKEWMEENNIDPSIYEREFGPVEE